MTTCVAAFRTEATFSCSSSTFSSKVARTSMHRPRTWRHTMQEDVRGGYVRGGVHMHVHMSHVTCHLHVTVRDGAEAGRGGSTW